MAAHDETGGGARERLLIAALEVFSERGYDGASIKAVAAQAGVAPGLIYHYFEHKEGLLEATIERHSILPELRRILAVSADRPARQVLFEIGLRFDRLLADRQPMLALVLGERFRQPAVGRVFAKLTATGQELLAGYLQHRVEAGELRPHRVELTARAFLATIFVTRLRGEAAGDWLSALVDLLLRGVATGDGQ